MGPLLVVRRERMFRAGLQGGDQLVIIGLIYIELESVEVTSDITD